MEEEEVQEEEVEEEQVVHIQMFVVELLSKCPSGKVSPTNRGTKQTNLTSRVYNGK